MNNTIYANRRFVIIAIMVFVCIVFIIRLFFIQIIDDSYKTSAANNSRRDMTVYAARGVIYDRDGIPIVYNEATYDLMVIPRQTKGIDTLGLCKLLGMSKEEYVEKIKKAVKMYSSMRPSPFIKQLSKDDCGFIQEKLYKYPGFYLQPRTIRKYPKPIAAHAMGYIGEAGPHVIEKDPYYKPGDYIGISGLEKFYEQELRGKNGVNVVLVDVFNRIKGSFHNGDFDIPAVAGSDLYCTISSKLQEYGENLMQNKIGSIVAIDPKTGEILSFVSAPTYDPNKLVGREFPSNYMELQRDPLKPLFNRALMAQYPPGSIFKMVQALTALEEGVISENTGFPCNTGLLGCHIHPTATDVSKAIQYSCNPYFFMLFKKIIQQGKSKSNFKDAQLGLDEWKRHVSSFGLGQRIKIDLPSTKAGFIPGSDFYNRWYGKNRWAFSTIYSNAIGQGEVEVVPIQMANLAAIFANKGHYYTPHLVKSIGKNGIINDEYTKPHYTTIDLKYFNIIHDAMYHVVHTEGGTARQARIEGINIGGKTGTAQNPHGEDHSVFIAFAPFENPKIAIAVYVENAGFGGVWAAPIASLMIEKYLTDTIKRTELEGRILEAKILPRIKK